LPGHSRIDERAHGRVVELHVVAYGPAVGEDVDRRKLRRERSTEILVDGVLDDQASSMRRPSASYSTAGFYEMPARRIVELSPRAVTVTDTEEALADIVEAIRYLNDRNPTAR
jgi:hypothetical protein